MAIELPPLPFQKNALEPYISRETMEVHHDKHHKKYVDTVNELIAGTPIEDHTLEEIMAATLDHDSKIYNNAAQAWNHDFFWKCLSHSSDTPSVELTRELERSFASMEAFKKEFFEESKNLFGSGWTWLTQDRRGHLKIRPMPNAGNALIELGETPLLVCDVWEHAYYLDYKNERPQYLENFWSVVNWRFVEANLSGEGRSSQQISA
jgi:Fe-Mn family superoxide dismutase